ncbi:hypothetical protein SBOR_3702 [Sclerotinia borealis F-4128]|uniref:Uncharacterized protein n=1 Tax=Sclerotinia borealis (strain F-4128) TaxID=1432307 RepID=W9CMM7_SCLBF|nr:hypothetical protein SBOR_3702 [Sclerotinia borealis F-4128]
MLFSTLKPTPSHLQKLAQIPCRFASTSTVTKSPAAHRAVYFGSDVYWGKAWKNVAGTGLLYVPVVAAVMFWPAPIAPLMNLSKGIRKEKVV